MVLPDGHCLRSHHVGLVCPPTRGCFHQFAWVRRVFRFVWVLLDVQVPLDVGALLFQDVGGLPHRPYGEERVCRRVRVVASGVRGYWFWSVRRRVVVSQGVAERLHGRRFAASGPGAKLVDLVLPLDAVLDEMVRGAAWMGMEHLVQQQDCWAVGLVPWASRSTVSLLPVLQLPQVLLA